MAYSYVLYNGTGGAQTFTVPFPYISRDHVIAQVDGLSVLITWLTDTSIQILTTVGSENVRIQRVTPSDPLVVFQDGTGLVAEDLNDATNQCRYQAEEVADAFQGDVLTNNSVGTANLQDGSVTNPKLATNAVTAAKIQADAVTTVKILDANVTTNKLANDGVTNTKLANMATQTIKGRTTAGTGDPEDLTSTQATAILDTFVGAGGSAKKGLVPQPAASASSPLKVLLEDSSWGVPFIGSGYILIRDEKSSGTAGGASVASAWTTRTLNTESVDSGNHATLSSNQITLQAGTYRVRGSSSFSQAAGFKIRLRNVSDSLTVATGMNSGSIGSSSVRGLATLAGRFTIATSKVFELQYYSGTATATDGLGSALTSVENEVYSELEFIRE